MGITELRVYTIYYKYNISGHGASLLFEERNTNLI